MVRGLDSLEALQLLAADHLQRRRVALPSVHRAHVDCSLQGERVKFHGLLGIQGAAGFEALDDALISPHEACNICSVAENLCSHLRHNCLSFSVNTRSAGSGSINGRGGG